jgi:uncharacterized protein YjiS (DUF1127 family)
MQILMAESLVQNRAAPACPGAWLGTFLRLPRRWMRRACARQELMALEPEQMRDCGLDPIAVRREALKPFWRE